MCVCVWANDLWALSTLVPLVLILFPVRALSTSSFETLWGWQKKISYHNANYYLQYWLIIIQMNLCTFLSQKWTNTRAWARLEQMLQHLTSSVLSYYWFEVNSLCVFVFVSRSFINSMKISSRCSKQINVLKLSARLICS